MKRKFSAFLVSLTAIILAVIMASGCSFINTVTRKVSPSDSEIAGRSVTFNTTTTARNIEDALVDAVAKVERSAVQIETENGKGSGVIVDISFNDTAGTGTPAEWKNDENMVYVVTCHHIVSKSGTYGRESAGNIEIRIPDEDYSYTNADYIFTGYIGGDPSSGYAVTLVGGDFESDIAVVKIDLNIAAKSGNKLSKDKIVKAQVPDDTYKTRRAEAVFSIGNPTGTLPGSVASGIVSYLARTVVVDEIGEMTLMQIDVSTNPGNSGGGLYNLYGELIGITNAGNTNYTNINFAIPCHLENGNGFVDIVKQLCGTASNTNYGCLSNRIVNFGFTVKGVNDNGEQKLKVDSVKSGSIADGKLHVGDEIRTIKINEGAAQNVTTETEFKEIMRNVEPGDDVIFGVPKSGHFWAQTVNISMRAEHFWFCNTGK